MSNLSRALRQAFSRRLVHSEATSRTLDGHPMEGSAVTTEDTTLGGEGNLRDASPQEPRAPRSLRGMLLVLTAATALPLALLATGGVWATFEAMRERAESAMLANAQIMAQAVDREFERATSLLRIAGASDTLRRGDIEAFRTLAAAVSTEMGGATVRLFDGRGQVLLDEPEAPQPWPAHRDAAIRSAATGRPTIESLSDGTIARAVVLVPIGSSDHHEPWILGLALPDRTLELALAERGLPVGWIASVVDGTGRLAFSTGDSSGSPVGRSTNTAPDRLPAEGVLRGIAPDGEPAVISYVKAPRSGYGVIISVPDRLFTAPLYTALTNVVIASALVVLGGFALFLLLARRVASALRILTEVAYGRRGFRGVSGLAEIDQAARVIMEGRARRDAAEQALIESNQSLTRALAERNLLLREVYHRVKNNLQVVDGLLGLQAARLPEGDARSALSELRSRVHALGLVHQQLLSSEDMATFDVAPFLRELAASMADGAPRGVMVHVECDRLRVNLDFAVPMGLLVTELVSSALKHAFATDGGRLSIGLRERPDGSVTLTVSDDGVGTDRGQGALGTRIIKGLVAQLDGEMRVSIQEGTHVEVFLPKPKVLAA